MNGGGVHRQGLVFIFIFIFISGVCWLQTNRRPLLLQHSIHGIRDTTTYNYTQTHTIAYKCIQAHTTTHRSMDTWRNALEFIIQYNVYNT